MTAALPFVVGPVAGVVLWWFTLRKVALREDGRRRRELGLPPRRDRRG